MDTSKLPAVRTAVGYMPMRAPGVPALMANGEGIPHPVVFDDLGDASARWWTADSWIGGKVPTSVARVEIRLLEEWPIYTAGDDALPLSLTTEEAAAEDERTRAGWVAKAAAGKIPAISEYPQVQAAYVAKAKRMGLIAEGAGE